MVDKFVDHHIMAELILRDGLKYPIAQNQEESKIIETWERSKKFISPFFKKDGSILDIFCGSAASLFSFSHWSGRNLVPYGYDMRKEAIDYAKKLHPNYSNNFICKNFQDVTNFPKVDYFYLLMPKVDNLEDVLFIFTNLANKVVNYRFIVNLSFTDVEKKSIENVINIIDQRLRYFKKLVHIGENDFSSAYYFEKK